MSGFFGTFVDLFGDTRSHAGRTDVGICLFADDPLSSGEGFSVRVRLGLHEVPNGTRPRDRVRGPEAEANMLR
jgi:hypothetical protein